MEKAINHVVPRTYQCLVPFPSLTLFSIYRDTIQGMTTTTRDLKTQSWEYEGRRIIEESRTLNQSATLVSFGEQLRYRLSGYIG